MGVAYGIRRSVQPLDHITGDSKAQYPCVLHAA